MIGPFTNPNPVSVDRRFFLKATGGAGLGLVLGFAWSGPGRGAALAATPGEPFAPNAFVRIAADDTVTVIAKHLEMGQGIYTGLATIVAEELDADWAKVRVDSAPADARIYNNLSWGPAQGTGGSSSIRNSYDQLRRAGALARAMLVAAAAKEWGVDAAAITVEKGVVRHAASGHEARFGALADKAAALTAPTEVKLKDPKDYKLVGKQVTRVDVAAKTNGSAIYALDFKLPDMLIAVVARAPVFGAKVKSFDAASAKAVPGVSDVVPISSGVAVVAKGFWAASRGREALAPTIVWDDSAAEKRSSAEIMAAYKKLAATPGAVAARNGNVLEALQGAAKRLKAEFEFPFLAHAPLEPLDCVVRLADGGCEIWAGDQAQTIDQASAAGVLGITIDKVKIHTLMAGGSFGRRATPNADYIVEAVQIAKALGGRAPVKLIWTREDDIGGGRYRPMYFHTLEAGLDAANRPVGWHHRIVGQSILAGTPFQAMVTGGIDATSVEGARGLPYDIPNLQVELHTTNLAVPILWWRSVGHTHTAHATEVFIDELAYAAGADPVAFRRGLLEKHPRWQGVLALAAEKSNWSQPLPKGKGRGIAVHESFESFAAEVAEVTVSADGGLKVDRIVCAIDCGRAINPDIIRSQMEGGIGFGLSAALAEAVTLAPGGTVEQSNFDDYAVMRIDAMPKVEVHIMASDAAPTGVGEPGVPPVAPAVANAIFAATGRRVRSLPFSAQGFRSA